MVRQDEPRDGEVGTRHPQIADLLVALDQTMPDEPRDAVHDGEQDGEVPGARREDRRHEREASQRPEHVRADRQRVPVLLEERPFVELPELHPKLWVLKL